MTELLAPVVPEPSEAWLEDASRLLRSELTAHRRRVRGVATISIAGVSVAAAATLFTMIFASAAAPAFAGWVASPTPPARGQLAAAEADCQRRVAQMPVPAIDSKEPNPSAAGGPVAWDVRGPFSLLVYATGDTSAICVHGPSFGAVGRSFGAPQAAAGQVAVQVSAMTNRGGRTFRISVGRVGRDVTGVAFALDGGGRVTASVVNGWYAAWWPGTAGIRSVDVTTPSGVTPQQP